MKTGKKTGPSISSDNVLRLECPTSWGELSQEQLHYVLDLIGSNLYSDVEIRTYMLFRFCGIEVLKKRLKSVSCRVRLENGRWHFFDLQNWQVQDMIGQLSFVGSFEDFGRGLDTACGFKAADKLLSDYAFGWYLICEKWYQCYLNTKDFKYLERLASWLFMYGDEPVVKCEEAMKAFVVDAALGTSVFFWFSWIKQEFSRSFRHFFKPVNKVGGEYNFLESYNAQIRALTDGDVTKEDAVRRIETRRALTELDAKAREAEEFKAKYGDK
jgi:hypothetical protein